MPYKPVPPKEGRSKVWRIRGTHRGVYLDRSTGIAAGAKGAARRVQDLIDGYERSVECGEFDKKPLTFADATFAYIQANGDTRFLRLLKNHFGPKMPARAIGQAEVDAAAMALYPQATPATRNRQVYTPISAILRHNGVGFDLRRPRGGQGKPREVCLTPAQFERVLARAREVDERMATMLLVACYTGLRLGEILGIRWRDLDGDAVTIPRTKNGKPRVAYLPPRARAAIFSMPAGGPDQRVFSFTRNGRLNGMAHRAYDLAAVDCANAPFHCLRHTWATWMVRLGVDLVATRAWQSQTAARNYTHFVLSEEARKADLLPGASVPDVRESASD